MNRSDFEQRLWILESQAVRLQQRILRLEDATVAIGQELREAETGLEILRVRREPPTPGPLTCGDLPHTTMVLNFDYDWITGGTPPATIQTANVNLDWVSADWQGTITFGNPTLLGQGLAVEAPALARLFQEAHFRLFCFGDEVRLEWIMYARQNGTPFFDRWVAVFPVAITSESPLLMTVDPDSPLSCSVNWFRSGSGAGSTVCSSYNVRHWHPGGFEANVLTAITPPFAWYTPTISG